MNQNQGLNQAAIKHSQQQHIQINHETDGNSNHQCCNACSNCGATINDQMNFCESCGTAVSKDTCFKCGHRVSTLADICEYCGTWLKPGLCKFCYSPVNPDTPFCQSCGNPYEGIKCYECGTLSYFDFCPTCNTALTANAASQKSAMQQDSNYKSYFEIISSIEQNFQTLTDTNILGFEDNEIFQSQSDEDIEPISDIPEELDKKYLVRQKNEATKRRILEILGKDEKSVKEQMLVEEQQKSLLNSEKLKLDMQKAQQDSWQKNKLQDEIESKMRTDEETRKLNIQNSYQASLLKKDQDAENIRKKEAARLQEKARIENIKRIQNENYEKITSFIKHTTQIKFATNQEARCYHMNIKPPRAVGWCCNLATVLHPDPMSCAEPAKGGMWMMEWNGITDPDKIPWEKNEYGQLICL